MARKELTKSKAKEYDRAKKKRKGEILDALCEDTGWSRDNARRQLKAALYASPVKASRKRKKKYTKRARYMLENAWAASGCCCGPYLHAQIQEGLIERLVAKKRLFDGAKNTGNLVAAGDPAIAELHGMSSATIDRYLKELKSKLAPVARATTRRSNYALRGEIPFGKSYNRKDGIGWLSADTVAHCGNTLRGDHIWTLNSTDVVVGWTETTSIKSRARKFIVEGHEQILPRFPFEVQGINYDGGSEFINRDMVDYAALHNYQMTRSRPYHSNDNAHVEQKNADIVRRHAFRYRYNGQEALDVLNELWGWVNLRKNYLVPTRKCIGHTKTRSGRTRGIYDAPKTPARRLLDDCADQLKPGMKQHIEKTLKELDDMVVTKEILRLQHKLLRLAVDTDLLDYVEEEIKAATAA